MCGLYAVLWGKAQETEEKTQVFPTATTDNKFAGTGTTEEDDQNNDNKEMTQAIPRITLLPSIVFP